MTTYLSVIIIILLFVTIAVLGFVDRRKKRVMGCMPPVSFLVPCYNDAETVGETIKSIYAAYGPESDVIVVDDGSTDESRKTLEQMKAVLGFRLIFNSSNMGKSKTLNTHFPRAKHNIIALVDADVIVSKKPLQDAISRLQAPDVGAVSCPYRSADSGFIPLMQTLEYNMLAFIQGAYNVFSAIAMWGGFIVIRREAFLKAGGFTLNAITEDMDLAFKLNKNGWRVEQSFSPIRTHVPNTFVKWFRQKIRWSSGGLQCFVKYHRVWIKNPLHVLFVVTFCALLTLSSVNIARNIFMIDDIIFHFNMLKGSSSLWNSVLWTFMAFGESIGKDLIWRFCFTLVSLPFVLPLVSTLKRIHMCFLVIPFSMLYVPAFSIVSVMGAFSFLRNRRRLQSAARAW